MNIDEDEGRKSETDLIACVLWKSDDRYCLTDCVSLSSLYMLTYNVDSKYMHIL